MQTYIVNNEYVTKVTIYYIYYIRITKFIFI